MLCANGLAQGVTKSIAVDGAGTFAVLAWLRLQPDSGTSNVTIGVQV